MPVTLYKKNQLSTGMYVAMNVMYVKYIVYNYILIMHCVIDALVHRV